MTCKRGTMTFPPLTSGSDETINSLVLQGAGIDTGNVLSITADELTSGKALNITSNSSDATSRNLVEILNDDASASGAVCLRLDQDADNVSLSIDTEATTNPAIEIPGPTQTSGFIINITAANGLTTGGGLQIQSNAPDSSTRTLANLFNDNASATGATCLNLGQDADNAFINFFGASSGGSTSAAFSTLTTSGAVQGHAQVQIAGVKRWIAILADPS